jgi:hypothetical protein
MKLSSSVYKKLVFGLALVLAGLCHAQTFPPGSYWIGSMGSLQLEQADLQGKQKFSLSILGRNAHLCDLDGVVHRGRAIIPDDVKPAEQCHIHFKQLADKSIQIETPNNANLACSNYCGAGVYFAGRYAIPPTACSDTELKRKTFLKLYQAKQYSAALQQLGPLLRDCKSWTDRMSEMAMRNDIAITYFHLKRPDECIRVLAPFTEGGIAREAKSNPDSESADNDEELISEIALGQPVFYEQAGEAIAAARTNLKRCGYKFPLSKP